MSSIIQDIASQYIADKTFLFFYLLFDQNTDILSNSAHDQIRVS